MHMSCMHDELHMQGAPLGGGGAPLGHGKAYSGIAGAGGELSSLSMVGADSNGDAPARLPNSSSITGGASEVAPGRRNGETPRPRACGGCIAGGSCGCGGCAGVSAATPSHTSMHDPRISMPLMSGEESPLKDSSMHAPGDGAAQSSLLCTARSSASSVVDQLWDEILGRG